MYTILTRDTKYVADAIVENSYFRWWDFCEIWTYDKLYIKLSKAIKINHIKRFWQTSMSNWKSSKIAFKIIWFLCEIRVFLLFTTLKTAFWCNNHNLWPTKHNNRYKVHQIWCAYYLAVGLQVSGGHLGRHLEKKQFHVIAFPETFDMI